jgi:arylsulfatase A-like enzyme
MQRPNILWIVTTQWRAQACGYTGDPNARTPVLDRLAAQSVNFCQAVTPHPFGPFARAAMFTGVLSPENGVRDYFDPLPVTARTVAHDLGERGYATAFFGKWHLAPRDPRAELVGEAHARTIVAPERRGGFEFWEGFESGFLLNDPWLHGTSLPEPTQFGGYQSDVLAARAGAWLQARQKAAAFAEASVAKEGRMKKGGETEETKGTPWFCVVSLEAPHPPYAAPVPAGMGVWDPAEIVLPSNVPRGGEAEVKARKELAGYYGHIAATDRAIGRLLESAGNETVVVFTSVHGDMHGAHGLFRKGWPHEESVRVPLLVRSPRLPGGAENSSNEPVSLVDLRARTLGWADGTATERVVRSRDCARISMPSVVALPHQCDRLWRGVRTATRKLVLNEDGSPWLFFDLEQDPLEQRNLVGEKGREGEIEALTFEVENPI